MATKPESSVVPPVSARMRLVAISRTVARYAGMWLLVAAAVVAILSWLGLVFAHLFALFLALNALSAICTFTAARLGTRSPAVYGTPLVVAAPVRGRWKAAASPASKVPNHGTHGGGQTYAIDLIFSPEGHNGPIGGWRPPAHPRA